MKDTFLLLTKNHPSQPFYPLQPDHPDKPDNTTHLYYPGDPGHPGYPVLVTQSVLQGRVYHRFGIFFMKPKVELNIS